MTTRFRFRGAALIMMSGLVLASLGASSSGGATEGEKVEIAQQAATLFRAARGVVSKNQALINDASKGDKGLDGPAVVAAAKKNFEKATGHAFPATDATLGGRSRQAMLEAVDAVMTQAQPIINEQGRGFKGFLPAVFAKQLATEYSRRMDGMMFIKLTAPKSYIRNRSNRPDSWEHEVIESKFKTAEWTHGDPFFESADHKGREAFRLILPEYYKQSCLKCHGEPKGGIDVTGGKMEGGKLGELGGAISVAIYPEAFVATAE